jgi:hypothetical protein
MFRFFRSKEAGGNAVGTGSKPSSVDNLSNVRREEADISGTKRRNTWKAKIDYIDSNNKINSITDLYRGICDFKKGCQLRTNIVKYEKGDFFTDSRSIVATWRKHYSQLLNVHGVNDVRQTEIHTADPLVPAKSAFGVKMAIEK